MKNRGLIWILVLILAAAAVFLWLRLGDRAPEAAPAEGEAAADAENASITEAVENAWRAADTKDGQRHRAAAAEAKPLSAVVRQTESKGAPGARKTDAGTVHRSEAEITPEELKELPEISVFQETMRKFPAISGTGVGQPGGAQLIESEGDIIIIVPEDEESDGF